MLNMMTLNSVVNKISIRISLNVISQFLVLLNVQRTMK
jgi:hypothetical protein